MKYSLGLIKYVIFTVIVSLLFATCVENNESIRRLYDLQGKRIAFQSGTVCDIALLSVLRNAEFKQFDNVKSAVEGLRAGQIDAIAHQLPLLYIYSQRYNDLRLLPDLISRAEYAFAVHLNNVFFKQRIDNTIEALKRDGVFNEMIERWFCLEGKLPDMPDFELVDTNGVLRFGISDHLEPFSYIDSRGKFAGFDVELAYHIAKEMEMDLEIVKIKYEYLIPSIIANRVHMVGGAIKVNEEKEAFVRFSEPYLMSGIGAMVRVGHRISEM